MIGPTLEASHLRLNFSICIRPCFSTARAKTSSASLVVSLCRSDVRRCVDLRDISLPFGQIQLAANAVDQFFAFTQALRIARRVAQTERRMPEFMQNYEAEVEGRQRLTVAAQFRHVAEIDLQREDVNLCSRRVVYDKRSAWPVWRMRPERKTRGIPGLPRGHFHGCVEQRARGGRAAGEFRLIAERQKTVFVETHFEKSRLIAQAGEHGVQLFLVEFAFAGAVS